MRSIARSVLPLVALLLLSACAGTPEAYTQLTDTRWQLDSAYQRDAVLYNERGVPYLRLRSADQRAEIFTGCNRVRGDYVLGPQTLRFDALALTRMRCANAMAQESRMMRALENTAGYRVSDTTLILLDDQGRMVARFFAVRED